MRVVKAVHVVALVAGGGKVNTSRKVAERVGLGVLSVAPLQLKAGLRRVIGQSLVARLGVLVAKIEAAVVAITLAIVCCCRYSPRTFGVYFAQKFQVPLVAEGEIITYVAQVKAAFALVAVSRHDKAAAVFLGKGKKTVGNGQG